MLKLRATFFTMIYMLLEVGFLGAIFLEGILSKKIITFSQNQRCGAGAGSRHILLEPKFSLKNGFGSGLAKKEIFINYNLVTLFCYVQMIFESIFIKNLTFKTFKSQK